MELRVTSVREVEGGSASSNEAPLEFVQTTRLVSSRKHLTRTALRLRSGHGRVVLGWAPLILGIEERPASIVAGIEPALQDRGKAFGIIAIIQSEIRPLWRHQCFFAGGLQGCIEVSFALVKNLHGIQV